MTKSSVLKKIIPVVLALTTACVFSAGVCFAENDPPKQVLNSIEQRPNEDVNEDRNHRRGDIGDLDPRFQTPDALQLPPPDTPRRQIHGDIDINGDHLSSIEGSEDGNNTHLEPGAFEDD